MGPQYQLCVCHVLPPQEVAFKKLLIPHDAVQVRGQAFYVSEVIHIHKTTVVEAAASKGSSSQQQQQQQGPQQKQQQ